MAQKDKVKELVGRGLDSYHTKSLQQIDRINKKNKEQNHKISILTNELDNDYLTKTEEGSVISLEHSKEGMVYLDELQGNTLVNYCTDGSKELTLNGDIDVEGTFVTTTEGVDNGLVDVVCEGNTLVNLATIKSVTLSNTGSKVISSLTFKQDTKYTLIFDVDSNSVTNESHEGIYLWFSADGITPSTVSALDLKGRKKYVMTRSDNANGWGIGCRNDLSGTVILNNILILEGDWTDREVPSYFEGMKSVGQDDTNGHKIEILSRNNGNLFDKNNITLGAYLNRKSGKAMQQDNSCYCNKFIEVKENDIIYTNNDSQVVALIVTYDENKNHIGEGYEGREPYTIQKGVKYIRISFYNRNTLLDSGKLWIGFSNDIIESKSYALNKKEISLSEPLRSLPNGVKDKFVKIGGKWYVERNCGEVVLNGSEDWIAGSKADASFHIFYYIEDKGRPNNIGASGNSSMYEKYKTVNWTSTDEGMFDEGWYLTSNIMYFPGNGITSLTEAKNRLKANPTKVVYPLKNPTYEELPIEPTLSTYSDITHISNNSTIPCNMQIKNSGYNAIIKPSTLYTVALDTNKSGTIGMNLGGAKGTTTNNVATITTPATLADDSLRLYGKGIKGSKVRLLEGDKTNWIPSHFEGMKSSFEDKLQEDGTYKMEILSKNRNLFNLDNITMKSMAQGTTLDVITPQLIQFTTTISGWSQIFCMVNLKPFTKYTLSADMQIMNGYVFHGRVTNWNVDKYVGSFQNPSNVSINKQVTFTTDKSGVISLRFTNERNVGVNIAKNIQISEEISDCVPSLLNKIQFSSIEPLRGVDNIKDRFVFKDGKLMIERNLKQITLENNDNKFSFGGVEEQGKAFGLVINKTLELSDCSKEPITPYSLPYLHDKFTRKKTGQWYDCIGQFYENYSVNFVFVFPHTYNISSAREYINDTKLIYRLAEPTYEEIPYELQKIILEGYENGTLFFDTNIPPTSTVTYAGATPIVKSAKSNRVEVASNTTDINDNIIPYLCDMDYRIVTLELQQQLPIQTGMFKLFGGVYEMLKRDILSKRLSRSEYQYRLTDYFTVGKLTEQQVRELEDLINE